MIDTIDKNVIRVLLDIGPTHGLPDIWELSGSKAAGEIGMDLMDRLKRLIAVGLVRDGNRGYAVTPVGAATYRKLKNA